MDWVLLLVMIVFFFLGYLAVGRLDKFLESPEVFPDRKVKTLKIKQERENEERVLVFGNSPLAKQLIKLLGRNDIKYLFIENERYLDKSQHFSYLCAISDSDLDNLVMSKIGYKMMNISKQVVLCNKLENKAVFQKNHVFFLYGEKITAEEIFYRLFPSLKEDGYEQEV